MDAVEVDDGSSDSVDVLEEPSQGPLNGGVSNGGGGGVPDQGMSHRHFSKSFSLPKICTNKIVFHREDLPGWPR